MHNSVIENQLQGMHAISQHLKGRGALLAKNAIEDSYKTSASGREVLLQLSNLVWTDASETSLSAFHYH